MSNYYRAKQEEAMSLLGVMFSAVFFMGMSNASTVQPVTDVDRTIFYRERASGMYSTLPYAFSQVAVETIYLAIQSIAYTLLLYFAIGLEKDIAKFFWFYYYMFMCLLYFTLYGMMAVALTPCHQIAAIFLFFFCSFWVLFSGFPIPRAQIPIWWRWYYWASPVSWTLHGLVTSQVGDKNSDLDITELGITIPLNQFLSVYLGFDRDFLPIVAAAHVGWVLLFLFVFAYGIKFLNFQKR